MESFYRSYPELEKRIKVGKNYFDRHPEMVQDLEKRVLNERLYGMGLAEDQDVLDNIANAYNTTRLDLDVCVDKSSETACKSLKFRGMGRCEYEKKWFSYIRGGNCFIDEAVIKHLLNNLQSFIIIRWNPLNVKLISPHNNKFPNPDELTKIDMINIIHDLTYHTKSIMKDGDVIALLEAKHGKSLVELGKK